MLALRLIRSASTLNVDADAVSLPPASVMRSEEQAVLQMTLETLKAECDKK